MRACFVGGLTLRSSGRADAGLQFGDRQRGGPVGLVSLGVNDAAVPNGRP
jgi:hypothetical protein